jgi:hypothetical protein
MKDDDYDDDSELKEEAAQEIIYIDREEADNIIARRHSESTDAGYQSARKKEV